MLMLEYVRCFGLALGLALGAMACSFPPAPGLTQDADVGGRREAVVGPIGLSAMTGDAFERLPLLRRGVRAFREGSIDRTKGNVDRVEGTRNILYTDKHGDRVILDVLGPGCVYRLWFTMMAPTERIKIYFDGEPTPRVDMPLVELFGGTIPPFLAPLVGDENVSSGGFYSYLPLPFARSIKVTTTNVGDYYYQADYHLYDPDVSVTSWTGTEDSTAARALWTAAGADPKPARSGELAEEKVVNVLADSSAVLADVSGSRSITRLHLAVPGVAPMREVDFADDGRAFTGSSTFTMKLDPANEGAVLQRRLDFSIPDQKATVYVDGELAGTWFDRGTDATFRDHSFVIPAALTRGKASVSIRVAFEPEGLDWNEFYYWAYSRVRGAEALTDELDVGKPASEAAHGYEVTGQTFAGTRQSRYPAARRMAAPLSDLWLRITWDDAATPSVDAPIGSFFAQGQYGPGFVKGLAAGMAPDGVMYMYFPMPFERHARIELVNKGSVSYDNVWFEVRHRPFDEPAALVGYFSTAYNAANPSTMGHDLLLLEDTGSGTVVGVVQSENGPTIRGYLEGDERMLVDDRRTPPIHGTGTEDLFTGGFYFNRGTYTLPVNGNPSHYAAADDDGTGMYRFFIPDIIPFRRNVRFTIEHGPLNDVEVNAWTLTYYYKHPASRMALTDTLAIGDATSEQDHRYQITGQTFEGSRTYTFEGESDTPLTASGKAHAGESTFELAVDPSNRGVILRRLLDQHIGRQRARVLVDGVLVGEMYTPQSNPHHAWREDELVLPASVTAGKTKLVVRVELVSSDADFNEFEYRALSLFD